jgi:hypothetical protein
MFKPCDKEYFLRILRQLQKLVEQDDAKATARAKRLTGSLAVTALNRIEKKSIKRENAIATVMGTVEELWK